MVGGDGKTSNTVRKEPEGKPGEPQTLTLILPLPILAQQCWSTVAGSQQWEPAQHSQVLGYSSGLFP